MHLAWDHGKSWKFRACDKGPVERGRHLSTGPGQLQRVFTPSEQSKSSSLIFTFPSQPRVRCGHRLGVNVNCFDNIKINNAADRRGTGSRDTSLVILFILSTCLWASVCLSTGTQAPLRIPGSLLPGPSYRVCGQMGAWPRFVGDRTGQAQRPPGHLGGAGHNHKARCQVKPKAKAHRWAPCFRCTSHLPS